MNPRKTAAAIIVASVAALAPTAALAAPTASTVQVDLTQLSGAVTTANTTLVADLSAITAAAQAGNRAAVTSDIQKFRSDFKTLVVPIKADRKQLVTDLRAARKAGVTGLAALVQPSIAADRAALAAIDTAEQQAFAAVHALVHPGHGSQQGSNFGAARRGVHANDR